MNLTKEQADWILEQLNRNNDLENENYICAVPYGKIVKILNRCVNAAPAGGWSLITEDKRRRLSLEEGVINCPVITIRCLESGSELSCGLTSDELSKHVDHCRKMLLYIGAKE